MPKCLIAPGYKTRDGYAKETVDGKQMLAHRAAFLRYHGYLPPVVRHYCDNPPCIEETHLLPGTQQDNMDDRRVRGKYGVVPAELQDVIRSRYAGGGVKMIALAEEYGVSLTTIHRVIRRKGRSFQ